MKFRFTAVIAILTLVGIVFAAGGWSQRQVPGPVRAYEGLATGEILSSNAASARNHGVSSDDISGGEHNSAPSRVQMSPEASISCEIPDRPTATGTFRMVVTVKNNTLSENAKLFVKVTFTRELYGWERPHRIPNFSLEPDDSYIYTWPLASLLPGNGYAMECELREHRTTPFVIGWRDRSVGIVQKTFSVSEFQSNNRTFSKAKLTECSASTKNLQVGDTVRLESRAKRKEVSSLVAASFIQIYREMEFVKSHPPPGPGRNHVEREVKKLTTAGVQVGDPTLMVGHNFTPAKPGLYTVYCFLHTGTNFGFTAKVRDGKLTLDEYYTVFSIFLPVKGLPGLARVGSAVKSASSHPANFWRGIFSGSASHLESVRSDHFCVGDPADCRFYSTPGEPDLVVESLEISKSDVEPGESFTLTASVHNAGNGASSETTLHYYRSTDSDINAEDPVSAVIGIVPSGSERVTQTFTAPEDDGHYRYMACVATASGETNPTNNCSDEAQVTVEETSQGSPDLVVRTLSVSKSEVDPGESFRITATALNSGDRRAVSPTLIYYRSTDSTISTSTDTKVGDDTVSSLGPSEDDDESISRNAPSSAGVYYYGACVVPVEGESNTQNNCSIGRMVTVEQAPQSSPDLVVVSPSASESEVDAGGEFTLDATVRNRGDGWSPKTTLRYYRSTDSHISTDDAYLETDDRVNALDPSDDDEESERLTVSEDSGMRYYGACVVPVEGESDTTNNCSAGVRVTVAQPVPDLAIRSVTATDTELEPGEMFTLTVWVANEGLASSSTSTLRVYRSTDSAISSGDTQIATGIVPTLGASQDQGFDIRDRTAPADAGAYYYGACVDSVSGESNTQNNCSGGLEVTVSQAGNPDMRVESFTVTPTEAETGESLELRATVLNSGNGTSTVTTLRFYRSTDSTISAADIEVRRVSTPRLGPGQRSYQATFGYAPASAGTYYYGACVDSVTGESNASDSCSPGESVTVANPPPDLVVSSRVNDDRLQPGESFTLTAAVRNAGGATSAATQVRFYSSADASVSAGDTRVGTASVEGLGPLGATSKSISLNASNDAGTYYYGACVDSVADESNTGNNCSSGVLVTVSDSVQTGPDLVVESFSASAGSVEIGQTFVLTATVRNSGDDASAGSGIVYYLSDDSIITTRDTLIVATPIPGRAPGEAVIRSHTMTASAAGAYYYGACVNSVAGETNTTNNCSSAAQVDVTEAAQTEVDLSVSSPTVTVSELGPGGRFRLDVTVAIVGIDDPSYPFLLSYLRSGDSTISSSDTGVGSEFMSLEPPTYSERTGIVLFAPSDAGVYHYGACANITHEEETNTQNNCSSGVKITVTQPTQTSPDLEVQTPSVNDDSLETGERFTLSATVHNSGDGASATTTLRYYRSADSTISTSDTQEGTDPVGVLDASGAESESIDLNAPSTAGTYYYGACVDSVSGESDTTNNCSTSKTVTVTSPPQTSPDLEVRTPTVSDDSPETGESFTLNATVENTGDGTSATTILRYYRSTDTTISTSDTQEGTDSVGVIAASGAEAESIDLTAPTDAGTYYYGACVDSVPGESDTTNNCSSSRTVTVTSPPQTSPDLVVESPRLSDSSLGTSDSFTLSATVRNDGDGDSVVTTLRYYRSSDSTISTSDTQVGTDSVGSLNPSDTEDESISLTSPSSSGTYYYGACVDSVSGESDTTNNCSDSVAAVVQSIGNYDYVVASFSVRDNVVGPGESVRLIATARNDGTGRSLSTALHYYLSTDSTITTSDTRVSSDQIPELNSGQTSRQSDSVSAPTATGTYYYGACFSAHPEELNTQNNCSSGVQVTVE